MRTPNADSKAGSHGNNSTEDEKKSIRIAGTENSDKSKRKAKGNKMRLQQRAKGALDNL